MMFVQNQTGNTTEGPPETPQTIIALYRIEGFKGDPQLSRYTPFGIYRFDRVEWEHI